jgi:hypothetical protein
LLALSRQPVTSFGAVTALPSAVRVLPQVHKVLDVP